MTVMSTVVLDVDQPGGVEDWMRAVQARCVAEYLLRVWLQEGTATELAAQVLRRAFSIPADEADVIGYCDAMAGARAIDADPAEWARDNAPESARMPGPAELAEWALEHRDALWQDADRFMRQIVEP